MRKAVGGAARVPGIRYRILGIRYRILGIRYHTRHQEVR
jgi:hypothetical protein